jgi:hypothetical protein
MTGAQPIAPRLRARSARRARALIGRESPLCDALRRRKPLRASYDDLSQGGRLPLGPTPRSKALALEGLADLAQGRARHRFPVKHSVGKPEGLGSDNRPRSLMFFRLCGGKTSAAVAAVGALRRPPGRQRLARRSTSRAVNRHVWEPPLPARPYGSAPVQELRGSRFAGAVRTAIHRSVGFDSVAHDLASAVSATWRHSVDSALEAVELTGLSIDGRNPE